MPHQYLFGLACVVVVAIATAAYSFFTEEEFTTHTEREREYYTSREPSPRSRNWNRSRRNSEDYTSREPSPTNRNWNRSRRNSEENCSICCYPLREERRKEITCGHVFHLPCLQKYMESADKDQSLYSMNHIYKCPLCRSEFVSEENCSICCYPLREETRKEITCGHVFHLPCLQKYMESVDEDQSLYSVNDIYKCPLCRAEFVI